jgi:hypothetical protein
MTLIARNKPTASPPMTASSRSLERRSAIRT